MARMTFTERESFADAIRRTIIDKGVKIPANSTIGYDIEADRQRFTVTDSGIVVVPKGAEVAEVVTV